MLKQVMRPLPADVGVRMADAQLPRPFSQGLEFNAPVHGTWNIVHTGMLVPEAHQVYVCAENCVRGVVMTAAEMGELGRFSLVVLDEKDLVAGDLERFTIDGVADVLAKLDELPPVVLLFLVCVHRFTGCDVAYVMRTLRARFPGVDFVECWMDPIRQKEHLTPEQELRASMYDPLRPCPRRGRVVDVLGSDFALDGTADLLRLAQGAGFEVRQVQGCTTYADYQRLAEASLLVCSYPTARHGIEALAGRLGADLLYLPGSFSYDEVARELDALANALCVSRPDCTDLRAAADAALDQARDALGGLPVAIDQNVHPRPLGLARLLLEHGFDVRWAFLDAVRPAETDDAAWLVEHAPDLMLYPMVQARMRTRPRGAEGDVLAIGQWAAWALGTPHFVDMVEGGGLWGFDGICHLARLMAEAATAEKDTKALVQRKGLGCASCL